MQAIAVESIGYDSKYYPRSNGKEDWLTVHKYRDALEADSRLANPKAFPKLAFPPLVVVRAPGKQYKYMLIDGLHRLKALTAAGFETVFVDVERLPESKWLARSVELNVPHGRGLDSGDKAWVASRLKADGWKMEKIAALLKMRVESMEKIVVKSAHKLSSKDAKNIPEGRGNREINGGRMGFVKSAMAETTGTRGAIRALQAQGPIASRSAENILDAAIAILESGGLDMKNEDIVAKLQSLEHLAAGALAGTV